MNGWRGNVIVILLGLHTCPKLSKWCIWLLINNGCMNELINYVSLILCPVLCDSMLIALFLMQIKLPAID